MDSLMVYALLLMVAHCSLFTAVVFIVFHFIAGASYRVYEKAIPFHGHICNEASLGQSTLLRESTPVALHPLWLVNSIQHTCSCTCSADQFSGSCI